MTLFLDKTTKKLTAENGTVISSGKPPVYRRIEKEKTRLIRKSESKEEKSAKDSHRSDEDANKSNEIPGKRIPRNPEDVKSKLKSMNLLPKNNGQKTSEGVQQFIKQVSTFIENKNPFKYKGDGKTVGNRQNPARLEKEGGRKEMPSAKPSDREKKQENSNPKREPGPEKNERSAKKLGGNEKISKLPSRSVTLTDRKKAADSGARERSRKAGNAQMENANRLTGFTSYPEYAENPFRRSSPVNRRAYGPGATPTQSESPRRRTQGLGSKPSEIPLRIPRNERSPDQNSVSLLMHKPISEAESTILVDVCKTFSPIREYYHAQDEPLIGPGAVLGRDEAKAIPCDVPSREELPSLPTGHQTSDDKEEKNIELTETPKVPNIPLALSSCDLTKKLSPVFYRARVLDLEKVKSSPFEFLHSDGKLEKLESYHRQTISMKENPFGDKSLSGSYLKASRRIHARMSTVAIASKNSLTNAAEGKRKPERLRTASSSTVNKPTSEESKSPRTSRSKRNFKLTVSTTVESLNCEMETKRLEETKRSIFEETTSKWIKLMPDISETKSECKPETRKSDHNHQDILDTLKTSESFDVGETETNVNTLEEFRDDAMDGLLVSNWVQSKYQSRDSQSTLNSSLDSRAERESVRKLSVCNSEDLIVRGTRIRVSNDKGEKASDSGKLKLEITIDLPNQSAIPMLPKNGSKESATSQESRLKHSLSDIHTIPSEECSSGESATRQQMAVAQASPKKKASQLKSFKSSLSLKTSKPRAKVVPLTRVKLRPKKKKNAADDDLLIGHFNSVTALKNTGNVINGKTKLRGGPKKTSGKEETAMGTDLACSLQEANAVSLKRRNSEPNSFKGFIWKQPEIAIFSGNKTSLSSIASSLRHMNADDLEDFRVWEAAPLKMASCWEMSLYNFRRPWSMLSCSVFKDDRFASTPGLMLENLRNGRAINMGNIISEIKRNNSEGENSFDVEPSIAQKNIDISNWLSSLNFSPPANSSEDPASECSICQPAAVDSFNRHQMSPKRRKIPRGLSYSEELFKKKFDDKRLWGSDKTGDLMELIRRNSGGFIAVERHNQHAPANRSPYLALINHESQMSVVEEPTKGRAETWFARTKTPEEKAEKVESLAVDSNSRQSSKASLEQVPTKPQKVTGVSRRCSFSLFRGDGINIWKYLFLLSLSLIFYNYFNNNYVLSNS